MFDHKAIQLLYFGTTKVQYKDFSLDKYFVFSEEMVYYVNKLSLQEKLNLATHMKRISFPAGKFPMSHELITKIQHLELKDEADGDPYKCNLGFQVNLSSENLQPCLVGVPDTFTDPQSLFNLRHLQPSYVPSS